MKIKELIEQLKKFDEEKEVIIRFGLGENDEMGYGLEPILVYSRIDDVCIAGEYNLTEEDCGLVGQVDLIEARNYYLEKKEEQENTIDLMAEALLSYADLGLLIKCPAKYNGKYFYKNCKIDVTKERTNKTHYLCKKCVKEYFKKKAKGE